MQLSYKKKRFYVVERYLPKERRWEEVPRTRVATVDQVVKLRDKQLKKGFRCRIRERFV